MKIIIGIIVIFVVVDIYYRVIKSGRYIRLLLLLNQITNKILVDKKVITREEIETARKEVFGNMPIGDYENLKKDLKKIGVDAEK